MLQKSPPGIFAAPALKDTGGSIEDDHRKPPEWYSQCSIIITHCKVVEEGRLGDRHPGLATMKKGVFTKQDTLHVFKEIKHAKWHVLFPRLHMGGWTRMTDTLGWVLSRHLSKHTREGWGSLWARNIWHLCRSTTLFFSPDHTWEDGLVKALLNPTAHGLLSWSKKCSWRRHWQENGVIYWDVGKGLSLPPEPLGACFCPAGNCA